MSYLLDQYQMWGYSSVAEHSTADREVTGSTPVAPSRVFIGLHVIVDYHILSNKGAGCTSKALSDSLGT